MPASRKKPVTIDDLWKLERIGAVALSPDGSQAVCSVSRYSMDDNKASASLWLLSTFAGGRAGLGRPSAGGGGPRGPTRCGGGAPGPGGAPDGGGFAFGAPREQEG